MLNKVISCKVINKDISLSYPLHFLNWHLSVWRRTVCWYFYVNTVNTYRSYSNSTSFGLLHMDGCHYCWLVWRVLRIKWAMTSNLVQSIHLGDVSIKSWKPWVHIWVQEGVIFPKNNSTWSENQIFIASLEVCM